MRRSTPTILMACMIVMIIWMTCLHAPIACAQSIQPAQSAQTLALEFELESLQTIDTPGYTAEIVGYSSDLKFLLSTNALWKTLDIHRVLSLDPLQLETIDFDPDEPDVEGVWTINEPTSVAVHPTLPIAFVVALGRSITDEGWLFGIDLRPESLGKKRIMQPIGLHPDCVAVSPDGNWLLIANEGEGHIDTPGGVRAVDLRTLTMDRRASDSPLPVTVLDGLDELLDTPIGDCEPEYIAFDPAGRFAAVSCQENDAIALVDMRQSLPKFAGVIFLPYGSQPDGVAVLDQITRLDKDGQTRTGCLVAAAEEGMFDRYGRWLGQSVSFTWVDPNNLSAVPQPMSRLDVRPIINPDKPNKRRDPESIVMTHFAGTPMAILSIERGDHLIAFDLTDPKEPTVIGMVKTGDRPEGLTLIRHPEHPDALYILTGDEGDEDNFGPGSLSISRLRLKN